MHFLEQNRDERHTPRWIFDSALRTLSRHGWPRAPVETGFFVRTDVVRILRGERIAPNTLLYWSSRLGRGLAGVAGGRAEVRIARVIRGATRSEAMADAAILYPSGGPRG